MKNPYQNIISNKLLDFFTATVPELTSEVLTDNGWELIGPTLPKLFYVFCLLVVNETTILVTGIY